MTHHISAVAIVAAVVAASLALAQEAPRTPSGPPAQLNLPPNSTQPPSQAPPIECDLKASPDYVPGIDVNGRDVAPADLSTGREVEIDTQVYVETRSKTPQRQRTGVIVNLPGLGAPACVPLQQKSPR